MTGPQSDASGDPLAYTPREAAAVLRISERLLWTLTQRGDIRSRKVGRLVRYYRPDLVAFMEGNDNGKPDK
jgi:excisionase family DNA binding protein